MKKAHWLWKPVSILALGLALTQVGKAIGSASGSKFAGLSLTLAAIGLVQYAFGVPRLPRLLWRIFGPLFSVAMIFPVASGVGWLATRLVIKQLTLSEQLATAGMLVLVLGLGLMFVVPLYRLSEWSRASSQKANTELTALSDTFA